jgi:hypothetical protein
MANKHFKRNKNSWLRSAPLHILANHYLACYLGVRGSMNNSSTDHPTWIYHALHEAKIVKASEAKLLYKKGWRDSPDPKILYGGFRGKYYKFKLWFRFFKVSESKHWNSFNFIIAFAAVAMLVIALLTYIDSNSSNDNNHIEQTK